MDRPAARGNHEIQEYRQHVLKDPATRKRIARPRPRSEWVVQPVPALRLVDDERWASVQDRLIATRQPVRANGSAAEPPGPAHPRMGGLSRARRPAWLLSGLVQCGLCSGPLTVIGAGGRLGCANHRERDTCKNRRTLLRDRLEERAMTGLKERLLAPDLVEAFIEEYVAETNMLNSERGQREASLEKGTGQNQAADP